MIHHPNLRNDFTDQLAMTKKSHHRTLRNHDTNRFRNSAHIGSGDVPAAKSQRHLYLGGHGIKVAAGGKDNSLATHHESTVQLRQFLDGSAKIEISDVQ